MKKLLLALTVTAVAFGASAQGLIRFVNDSKHLVYYATGSGGLLGSDTAGSAVDVSGLTSAGHALNVDLFYGTASDSLSLLASTTMSGNSGTPGTWAGTTVSGLTSGARYYFQVMVYDAAAGSYATAAAGQNFYYGESSVFQTTASTSAAPSSIVTATGVPSSTWAAGTQAVTGSVPGGLGAISIMANVPEPTSFALFGLGAASLMIFRRRK